MATPSVLAFDAEGRAIDFEVWVDDLQLFLQCDRADGLSLFDLTSSASRAPAADADATVRSQWATRDATARLAVHRHLPTTERAHFSQYKSAQTLYDAVVAHYSSPATTALSRLMLPYLFPDLAAFPTVADLITHLRTSDTRYRAALPADRSVRRLPLAGDAALARARGARTRVELAGVAEVAVEAAEGVGVAVGVVAGVEVSVAAVEAKAAEEVAVEAQAAVVAEVEEVELVGVALRSGAAPVVVSASSSSSSVLGTSPPLSSSVSGTLRVSVVGVLVRAPTSFTPATARFPEATEIPRWGELSRAGVAIFDLDFDAILAAMYAVTYSDEGDCYRCFPPDPGIETAALDAGVAAALGSSAAVALGAIASLLWTGKVGDASTFRVWGSRAFVRDLSADKLSPRAAPCVFLGFPPDAPGWQFYHPTSRRVLSSQDVTFDESVPYYRLFPYRTLSLPPAPLFMVPGPPPVDPLPPQGPTPLGVSQVDAVEPVEVSGDSGAPAGAEPGGGDSGGAARLGAAPRGAVPRGAETGGAELGGSTSGAAEPGGAASGANEPEGVELAAAGSAHMASGGAGRGGSLSASSRREPLSSPELREWLARRWRRTAGAGAPSAAEGAGAAGLGGARPRSAGAAGKTGPTGAGAAEGVGAEDTAISPGTGPAAGAAGAAGGTAAGGTVGAGAAAEGANAVPAVSEVAARPRPYFVPLLQQVLGLPSPLECPAPVQSQSQLPPASPLPAPSPYSGPTRGLAERREPASRPALPVRAARASGRGSRQRPRPVPSMHRMSLRPSTAPLRVPLPSPPTSSLPPIVDPESDSLRAASPTVTRLLATVVTDPSFESTVASALVAELADFVARCRLDYAASLVVESASVYPPSVGDECALGTDVLEDRPEEFQCLATASPHLVSVLLTLEGDPDALDIPIPRSYAEAVEGPYSSQWQAAMDAEMASWKSTRTYVDAAPPLGANMVSGMWIFKVKRPPRSPPVLKARYVAHGFSQRQGVDYFQTFSPTPKMTTLRAPREWHDTLRTALAALGFAPSTAHPSLFLRTDTSLPPFYILVYVDDLVFATADTAGLAHVKSELQKRHTCTDLGELRSYLGLHITRDRARRTITLTQSHMVQQVLQRFGFTYSSPQATPLPTRPSLSAVPSDESIESSGPYPELVGCLMYLMTCIRPDLAYPLSILARYVAPGRHRPEHMAAAKRVLRCLCSTSGMGLVLGERSPVVLTGHADASWADDQATQRSSQGYTFSLNSGSVLWRATRSSSVIGSSCVAEIYAGAMAAQELRWLTYLLTNLGEPPRSPPVLYVDNKAMLALCREQRVVH
ncbi:unnamed protein product [Closterium sp. NIES-54]